MKATWYENLSADEKAQMAKATMLKKAEVCDCIARLVQAKRRGRRLNERDLAHYHSSAVMPSHISDATEAATYWRTRAAEIGQ